MDEERASRLVASLRARGVMAHLARQGVYQCAVRVVLPDEGEAVWDSDGALGLDAEVLEDGVLIGFVPHVEGSEDFTEEQLVEAIATTQYSKEGLHPPTIADVDRDASGTGTGMDQAPGSGPTDQPAASHRGPRRHWWTRPSG